MIDHDYEPGRLGDDGVCHARITAPHRCYMPRREHKETSVTTYRIKDMPKGTRFTANGKGLSKEHVHRFRLTGEVHSSGELVLACETHHFGATAGYVDESTIRDVVYPQAQEAVEAPVEDAEKPKQHYYLEVMYTNGAVRGTKCTDIDQDTDNGFLTVFGLSEDKTRTINLRYVQFYDVRPLQEDS